MTWGSRLAGGLSFAINFEKKTFLLESNYSPDNYDRATFDDDHHYVKKDLSICEGFDRIYEVFVKVYKIDQEYRMYLYQEGVSFYYEREKDAVRNTDETMKEYRKRTYRIYKVGTKQRKQK